MARPKAFDEDTALEAAMACFWERGYQATSIRDLTEVMGIASPSLYNAFGDKRALFIRALETYCRAATFERISRLEAELPSEQRVPAFLAEVVTRSVEDKQRRGCFLINSAIDVAPHDSELGAIVSAHLGEVRAFFLRSLEQAADASRSVRSADPAQAADHLMAVLLGIRVLARTRPERDLLEGIVAAALAPLGLRPAIAGA